MELYGVLGDVEAGGDFLIAPTFGEEREDFAFAGGEGLALGQIVGVKSVGLRGQEGVENFGRDDGEPGSRGFERSGDFVGSRIAQQESAHTGLQGAANFSAGERSQEQNKSGGAGLMERVGQSVGSIEIKQDDLGRGLAQGAKEVDVAIAFADEVEASVGAHEGFQPGARDRRLRRH